MKPLRNILIVAIGCIAVLAGAYRDIVGQPPAGFLAVATAKYALCRHNKVIRGVDGWLFYEPELSYVLGSVPDVNTRRIVEFDRTLRRLGTTLFVVPVPNKIDVYPEKFTAVAAPDPVQRGRSTLLDQLRSQGVQVVDLVPEYRRLKDSCRSYDQFQTHWTAAGIAVASKAIVRAMDPVIIAKRMERNGIYTLRDTTVLTFGDLRNRLNGRDKPQQMYPERMGRIYCSDGSPFHDEKSSRILILGDSYIDHLRWWNAHLGAHIAHDAAVPTRSYFSLLANYNGPCMYEHKPSAFPRDGIVVWVFTSRVLRTTLCPDSR